LKKIISIILIANLNANRNSGNICSGYSKVEKIGESD